MQDFEISNSQGADRFYFDQLALGKFFIPLCQDCGKHHFFPRLICPHCGSNSLHWVEPSGNGEVYSTTVVRRADGDYTVCLINLDEGPRMMSRVVDMVPSDVRIGLRVKARVDQIGTSPLLVFTPDEGTQA